jgi:predicted transposase/invertase (TIGR01784 family)
LTREQLVEFFLLVDGVLALTPNLSYDFEQELAKLEERSHMPYVSPFERRAIGKGRREGRKEGREEGRREGRREEKRLLALRLIASGMSREEALKLVDLPELEVPTEP